MGSHQKLIEKIQVSTDVAHLRNWIENGTRQGAPEVVDAARRRLIEVEAAAVLDDTSDPLVLDFWKSITALELALTDERGKTTRLARTRQKLKRVGVLQTLIDLTMKSTPSEGYYLLKERGMLDLSAEAVVLRFPDRFDEGVLRAARTRLENDGPNK